VKATIAEQIAELRGMLKKVLDAQAAPPVQALKRAQAAQAMSVSVSKLDALVRTGKVRTAEDSHLIPMAEIRRYCAPKVKRERRPAVGHRARMKAADGQSDDAIAAARELITSKARAR
jgi:hypothetical protein